MGPCTLDAPPCDADYRPDGAVYLLPVRVVANFRRFLRRLSWSTRALIVFSLYVWVLGLLS